VALTLREPCGSLSVLATRVQETHVIDVAQKLCVHILRGKAELRWVQSSQALQVWLLQVLFAVPQRHLFNWPEDAHCRPACSNG
jgi:hypothetical protein